MEPSHTFSVIHSLNVVDIYWPSQHMSPLQLLGLADVNSLLFFILLPVFLGSRGGASDSSPVQKSGQMQELALSFSLMDSRDQTQVLGLGGKDFYLLSFLPGPRSSLLKPHFLTDSNP